MTELTKRQEEIIQSSIQIIDKRGIQGLTIKNLAKKLELLTVQFTGIRHSVSLLILYINNIDRQSFIAL